MRVKKEDKLVENFQSPLSEVGEMIGEVEDFFDEEETRGVSIEGDLDIGKKGHPVTLMIEDEVSGEVLEMNHIESAFLVIEDKRKSDSGWLAVAIGEVKSLSKVLSFLAKSTLESLKKMVERND